MFKKWPSIENHYRTKEIAYWLDHYPELQSEVYVVTEKLHGANLQIYFQPNKPFQVGSRNRFLEEGDKFYDVWNTVEKYRHITSLFQVRANFQNVTIRLFGELFGMGVQKGVKYQDEHKLAFFGYMENDVLCPFAVIQELMIYTGTPELLVPVIDDRVYGLDAALAFSSDFDSRVLGVRDNTCEGIVIQPFINVYESGGNYFMLKKKNEAFKEKSHQKKERVVDEKLESLNTEFATYLTDNRLQGVFSKYGEIETPKQIGQYIGYMLKDAKDDFLKDFPEVETMGKGEQKQVFNVGGTIANMLKEYL